MSLAKRQLDERADKKRAKGIFGSAPDTDSGDRGVTLMGALRGDYMGSLVFGVLKAGGSPTINRTRDGNAIRFTIYHEGVQSQSKYASSRKELDKVLDEVEAFLEGAGVGECIRQPRWTAQVEDWDGA